MSVTLIIVIALVLGVIFVNGWTDAPNAIATVVSTRSMHPRKAIIMAAIMNFFGVLVMTSITPKVATTIGKIANFGTGHDALVGLAAGLVAIIVFAVVAWYFGIPTSESHALIAGITGAAISIGGFSGSVSKSEWLMVIIGLGVSSVIGFGSGFLSTKLVELLFRNVKRNSANKFFNSAQIASGASMAFLHGAQDGQKFMGVFMLGIYLSKGADVGTADFDIPIWVMVLCSLVMGLGTSIGGYKIIKSVGMDMVKLEKYQGFSADLAASLCLLFSTIVGIPISTTHTKTTAIMGVGASKRLSRVNWSVVKEMFVAWGLTFPVCGAIGFLMSKLFMVIF